MINSNYFSGNIYIFSIIWFLLAYFSTSSYLLVSTSIMEATDSETKSWRLRLIYGVLFQFSWTFGRLFSNFVVYLCQSWINLVLILTLILIFVYISFEDCIWDDSFNNVTKSGLDKNHHFLKDFQNDKVLQLNIMVLSIFWFTLGYNYYGMMNSWVIISANKKIFEHNVLASVLALVSKICAILVCIAINRKILPLMILQILTFICYFVLSFAPFGNEENFYGIGQTFVVHLSTFLITASFALIWAITPETFPQRYR